MSNVSEIKDEVVAISSHMFKVRFPFVSEMRHYSWVKFRADLIAGATLTLVSIPQAIGFALILNSANPAVIWYGPDADITDDVINRLAAETQLPLGAKTPGN